VTSSPAADVWKLAHAIVEDAAPLTARVIVNRVWKQSFGPRSRRHAQRVGNLGDKPTHPNCWTILSGRFIEHGWSIKWLHSEILNSATWQPSSLAPESERRDPENKLFARMNRRRLDWESWRDAMISATGLMICIWAAPPSPIADAANQRRSLYGASNRQDMDPMLRIMMCPIPAPTIPGGLKPSLRCRGFSP